MMLVGQYSIGEAIPGAALAVSAGVSGINGALPDIQARLSALLAFKPLPVTFATSLQIAQQTLTSLQANIALGLPVPSITAQIAEIAALVGSLSVQVASINAQLSIVLGLQGLLDAAGVYVFAAPSTAAGSLGGELDGAIAGAGIAPGAWAGAAVLVTTVPATWDALASMIKVSP